MFRRILTPIDFEQADLEAPSYALEMAEKYAAELHLLHVLPESIRSRLGGRNRLQTAQDQLEQQPVADHKITVRRTVRQGTLADSVIDYARAENIDLVVIDQHCAGITSERAFKVVANRLLDSLDCPVLLTRPREASLRTPDLQEAATFLFEQYGQRLIGDRATTQDQMQTALAQHLRLSQQQAEQLFSSLQKSQVVQWFESDGRADTEDKTVDRWEIRSANEEEVDFAASSDLDEGLSAAVGLIRRAIASRATDVHIDPAPSGSCRVRFRIDGRVQEYCTMQNDVAASVMKQLKVMANVSLADPFQPNESRLQLPRSVSNYEVRITTAPVVNGESIALRLIDCDKLYRPLNELGLSASSFAAVYEMLHRRTGLVLIAGPTGAGKTTTAYSMLNVLFSEQQNIVSIEDPVELLVPFMRQLSVDKRHGLTMDVALATVLRMDPDVLFVGEIRNTEAAQVAMQAAGCGKRAFSTMHMRDCAANVTAMRKLDVDAMTLAENVSGIITQRLVRRLCTSCAEEANITKYERELFTSHDIEPPLNLLQPRGCDDCRNTGYRDRIGVFEAVVIDGDVADGIRQNNTEAQLRERIRLSGTPDLVADGLAKVVEGITSIHEIQQMSWLADSEPSERQAVRSELLYERGAPYKKAL